MTGVSVIITTRNEEARIGALLDSLVDQSPLADVCLVDANSSDRTIEIARTFLDRLPLKIQQAPCTRGQGRNMAARMAEGDLLAFIDGDCIASPGWVAALWDAWDGQERLVVAGATQTVGRFRSERAPILIDGEDISWPSCNLAYSRRLFDALAGFDGDFLTAEDMDLNLRAVQSGAHIVHVPEASVHASTRDSWRGHLRQARDNGYGRAQLEAKHGPMARTSKRRAILAQPTPSRMVQLWAAWRGYRAGKRDA